MVRLEHGRARRRPLGVRIPRRDPGARGVAELFRKLPPRHLFSLPRVAFAAGIARNIGVVLAAAPLVLVSHAARADEGGSSFWTPGAFASLAATPMEPGLTMTAIYYRPSVSSGKEVAQAERVRIRGRPAQLSSVTDENTSTTKDQGMVTPTYTLATPVLGGQANVSVTAVYSTNTSILNEIRGARLSAGSVTALSILKETTRDTVTGFGDMSPQVSLRWNAGFHNIMTYATGNIPVGLYNPSSLANIGIGHGALDGGVGYTYFDEQAGREFSAVAGLTYNFLNPYTQYQNGVDFHLDWAASQFFYKNLQIGLVGYTYNQLTCDSGSGNSVGCFASQVASIGAQLGYTLSMGDIDANVNFRGYQEFAAANRPEGWNLWMTLTLSPAASSSKTTATKRGRPIGQ